MFKAGTLINQCYILREYLGEDSCSSWWRASAIFVASDFLIRFLKTPFSNDEPLCRQLIKSARELRTVIAPSILNLIEIDICNGHLYIANEYDGYTSLNDALMHGVEFTIDHACRLTIELAQGIDCFHQHETTFGLLNTESIIVKKSNSLIDEIKIQEPSYLPFLELISDENIQDIRNNWAFAAPELKRGKSIDARSDVYSLGVILFRMLSGKLPYGTRSGLRIKERSAAPYHITAALARRGIPAEIAMINLRALRKNPKLRYQNCLDFITDLQVVLNKRREQSLREGKSDPIAELATLNARKVSTDARALVRTLDTVEYFSLLSTATLAPPLQRMEINPARDYFLANKDKIEELEELEAEGEEDEDSIAIETYIQSAYEKVQSEWAGVSRKSEQAQKPVIPESAPAPLPGEVAPEPQVQKNAPNVPIPHALQPQTSHRQRKPETSRDTQAPIQWVSQGGAPEQVTANMLASFRRSKRKRASFSFIEETGPGAAGDLMLQTLSQIRSESLMLDLGVLSGDLHLWQLESFISQALIVALKLETKRSRGELHRKLIKENRRFLPILEGTDVATEDSKPHQGEINLDLEALSSALAPLGRPSRPLVLVAHGGQAMSRECHDLLVRIATTKKNDPICMYIFFEGHDVPSWHSLSALNAPEAHRS